MAEKTNSELNTQALEIKNETVQSANSATRVGQLFEDISDSLANKSEVNAIYETGRTLTNNIVFDKYSINYAPAYGGTWALTSSGVGNISADSYASVVIEQPTSVTIDSEWNSQGGSQPTPDITKRIEILLHKDSEGNVFYIISNNEIQGQDITAPTVNSATIQDAAPDELIVVFSEAVNVTNTTGLSFSDDLMATTIDSIISGNGTATVTFQLGGTAVQNGDVANFVYAGTNTIEDLAGNALAASATAVTNNVGGDVTAPTASSATVENADPDALVVVFSEAVNVTNVTGLTLTGDWTGVSVSSVTSGSGTDTVTFALDTPIANGETGSFSYDGTNTIDDLAGNSLVAGSTPVTNNVSGGAAPVLQTAAYDSTNNRITLTYDIALDETSVPDGGDFTNFSVARVRDSVAVSGTEVQINLVVGFADTDVITLDYTAGSSPIRASGGGTVAANLTSQSVTNNAVSTFSLTDSLSLSSGGNTFNAYDTALTDMQQNWTMVYWAKDTSSSITGSYGLGRLTNAAGTEYFTQHVLPTESVRGTLLESSGGTSSQFNESLGNQFELDTWTFFAFTWNHSSEQMGIGIGVGSTFQYSSSITPSPDTLNYATFGTTGPIEWQIRRNNGTEMRIFNAAFYRDLLSVGELGLLFNSGTPVDYRTLSAPMNNPYFYPNVTSQGGVKDFGSAGSSFFVGAGVTVNTDNP